MSWIERRPKKVSYINKPILKVQYTGDERTVMISPWAIITTSDGRKVVIKL